MSDPFVHLRTVSSFSLRHGVSTPEDLVARAAELGQSALALTDRDGLYGRSGSSRHAGTRASPDPRRGSGAGGRRRSRGSRPAAAGLRPSPLAGLLPGAASRSGEPGSRLVVLARAGAAGRRCADSSPPPICTASGASRRSPASWSPSTPAQAISWSCSAPTPGGPALERRRADVAAAELRWWLAAGGWGAAGGCGFPPVAFERDLPGCRRRSAATHRPALQRGRSPSAGSGCGGRGGRRADQRGALRRGLGGAGGGCARRHPPLVPLDLRHLDRANAQGYLKGWPELHPVAHECLRSRAGRPAAMSPSCSRAPASWRRSASSTRWATSARRHPRAGAVGARRQGIAAYRCARGAVAATLAGYAGRRRSHAEVDAEARRRSGGCAPGARAPSTATWRAAAHGQRRCVHGGVGAAGRRARHHRRARLRRLLPHRGRGGGPHPRHGVRSPRGSGAGSLVNHLLGISGSIPCATTC